LPLPGDDDPIIREYLLGRLPEKEVERLDELSIADDDFALRLTAAENDLVDAYVRGELPAESRDRFRSFYLASPKRREKVRFAELLLANERTAQSPAMARAFSRPASDEKSRRQRISFFQRMPQWGFAFAALFLLLAASLLLIQNRRLNTQIASSETERERLEQREQELSKQLEEQRSATAERAAASQPPKTGAASSTMPIVSIPAFLLAPALRGGGTIPTIAAPAGAKQIKVSLQLEWNNFSKYRVTLKDPAAGREIWRSGEVTALSNGENKVVSVMLPASKLREQNYVFEVSGITSGAAEFITSYSFRFVVK
jgi:hypothetical protein